METVQNLFAFIDVSQLYEGGVNINAFIWSTITPFLLVLAIWIRMFETSVEYLSGEGKWGRAVKSFVLWAIALSLYFGLLSLAAELFNALYGAFSAQGSMSKVLGTMKGFFDDVDAKLEASGGSWTAYLNPVTWVPFLTFFISLVLLMAVDLFFQVAHAIGYSLAVAWGLIAIPISITSSFKLLKPWAMFLGALMVWPIVHMIFLAFLDPLLASMSTKLLAADVWGGASTQKADLYTLFTIVNLLLVATLIAAPFVTWHLLSSGSIAGLVAPFAGGALAATGAIAARFMKSGGQVVESFRQSGAENGALTRAARGLHDALAPQSSPRASMHNTSGNAPQPPPSAGVRNSKIGATQDATETASSGSKAETGQSASAAQAAPGARAARGVMASSNLAGEAGDPAPSASDIVDEQTAAATRQAKRGAVLDKLHKRGDIQLKGRKD